MPVPFQRVAILGVGLIGGSLAKVLRKERPDIRIMGSGRTKANLKTAESIGVIDGFDLDPAKAVAGAELVVLSPPVRSLESLARKIAHAIGEDTIVTDVGSVKKPVVDALEPVFSERGRFVGGHPIAGREKSGVGAATDSLFLGSRCILTPTPRTDRRAFSAVRALWEIAGCRVTEMPADVHDNIFAAVSHLPHVAAYALVNAVSDVRIRGEDPLIFSGGGFRDYTRIAESSPEMWRDICLMNAEPILRVLDGYEGVLNRLKQMIAARDGDGLLKEFERARRVKEKMS